MPCGVYGATPDLIVLQKMPDFWYLSVLADREGYTRSATELSAQSGF
jgi:hypothetical protein